VECPTSPEISTKLEITRLKSIYSHAGNYTVSYVHSLPGPKKLFSDKLFSFFAATLAWSGFGPYYGMWREYL
jgi:hypothetical protein